MQTKRSSRDGRARQLGFAMGGVKKNATKATAFARWYRRGECRHARHDRRGYHREHEIPRPRV